MFKHARNAFVNRFAHPILVLMYVIAGVCAVVGVGIQLLAEQGIGSWEMGAAFFGVYVVFFASVATVGYLVVYAAKYVSVLRDRMGPAA